MTDQPVRPDRRRFLATSLLAGASGAVVSTARAQPGGEPPVSPSVANPASRPPWLAAAERGEGAAAPPEQHVRVPGSDFMVDCLQQAGIDYIAVCPGSTFRGLQESIVNYGGDAKPEMIVCVHEEISAAICHGYAKVAGKPMACLVHSNVGIQHASMAIYNAWCDHVPMVVIAGNVIDATKRRAGVEWTHAAQDLGAMVRDFVKWDDTPISLQHYGESFMRACSVTMTPPMQPVMIVADAELQEDEVEDAGLRIPRLAVVSPPVGEPAAVAKAAALLAAASNPVIVADRCARTPAGFADLVRLAEAVNAPVVDLYGRLNFPTSHYLNQTWSQQKLIAEADLILGLELTDVWGVVNTVSDVIGRPARRLARPECKVVAVNSAYLSMGSNNQDFERYFAADVTIAADAEATLPLLIAAVERELTPERRTAIGGRRPALEAASSAMRETNRYAAARGWDASPISTARMCMELWDKIKGEDWAVVSHTHFATSWPQKLWDFTQHHQFIGGEGGYGIGYNLPAALGAALAHKKHGRLPVNIQGDGDFMMLPGTLWSLAHHQIPLLTVMHNNRAWHQETMHLQRMTNRRQRSPERAPIGTVINDPPIDYAAMARSMGVWAAGPISDPAKLGPAITRALAVVKSGKPALLDVLTQPR